MINTRYWRHARVKCSLYSPSASRTRTNLKPVGLIFPSRHAHAHTHTRKRACKRLHKGSVRRIARGDLSTRCGEVHAETGDPWRHTAVSIHGSLGAEQQYPHVQLLLGRPLSTVVGTKEGKARVHRNRPSSGGIDSARLKIGKGWSRRRGAIYWRTIKEGRRLFVQRNVTKV